MTEQNPTKQETPKEIVDHTGTVAEALFIANLLFIGIFYLVLWGLYFLAYKNASPVSKNHLKQTLVASTLSTLIVVLLNIFVLLTAGYASATALITAEIYLMLIVPLFMIVGILGFTKAVNEKDYKFPIIGNLLGISNEEAV